MHCPLLRIQTGQKGECLRDQCEWWLQEEGGGCAMVWMVVWLERLASKFVR